MRKPLYKTDSPSTRRVFYEKVAKKSQYLNPEIVEEVWINAMKVAVEQLKDREFTVLPYLAKVSLVRYISTGERPKFMNNPKRKPDGSQFGKDNLQFPKAGVEYYRLYVRGSIRLRRYFSGYLQNKKKLDNLVPESPATLLK